MSCNTCSCYPELGTLLANPGTQTNFYRYGSTVYYCTQGTDPHFVIKCTNLLPLLFFYRFLFIPGSTAHKQKAHVLLCKVGQRLLCALQCH